MNTDDETAIRGSGSKEAYLALLSGWEEGINLDGQFWAHVYGRGDKGWPTYIHIYIYTEPSSIFVFSRVQIRRLSWQNIVLVFL